jgi:hypothetical protein
MSLMQPYLIRDDPFISGLSTSFAGSIRSDPATQMVIVVDDKGKIYKISYQMIRTDGTLRRIIEKSVKTKNPEELFALLQSGELDL